MTQPIPEPLLEALKSAVGVYPEDPTPLANRLDATNRVDGPAQSVQVVIKGRNFVLKWLDEELKGYFTAESKAMKVLTRSRTFRVPRVILAREQREEVPGFLLQEWIPPARKPVEPQRFEKRLAEHLAALHRRTARAFGLDHDNYLGSIVQKNPWTADFATFYRDSRIRPQVELAQERNALPSELFAPLEALMERLPDLLETQGERPALLHGDLWQNNLLADEVGEPTIIDPAISYGHRETELAFAHLNNFSVAFFRAYEAAHPLPAGHEARRPVHQLYYFLVHANHFPMGSAVQQVDEVLRLYRLR